MNVATTYPDDDCELEQRLRRAIDAFEAARKRLGIPARRALGFRSGPDEARERNRSYLAASRELRLLLTSWGRPFHHGGRRWDLGDDGLPCGVRVAMAPVIGHYRISGNGPPRRIGEGRTGRP